jgi:hypothetical protein
MTLQRLAFVSYKYPDESYISATEAVVIPFADRQETTQQLQSRAEQSSCLLLATSQHGHSWHRAPPGPMAIYLFCVKTFFFLLSLFLL